jgi:hypothetical protein
VDVAETYVHVELFDTALTPLVRHEEPLHLREKRPAQVATCSVTGSACRSTWTTRCARGWSRSCGSVPGGGTPTWSPAGVLAGAVPAAAWRATSGRPGSSSAPCPVIWSASAWPPSPWRACWRRSGPVPGPGLRRVPGLSWGDPGGQVTRVRRGGGHSGEMRTTASHSAPGSPARALVTAAPR